MSGRDLTLREAAGATLGALQLALVRVPHWDCEPGVEVWAMLADAAYVLRRALARDDEAHALAMLAASHRDEREAPPPVGEAAGED